MEVRKRKNRILKIIIVLILVAIAIPVVVFAVAKSFTAQESVVRTDWEFETGGVIATNDQWQVEYTRAELGEGLHAFQLVPADISREGFTFYDVGVQERLEGALEDLKAQEEFSWTADRPLAVLNPYGTGSNGLYLYFETDVPTQASYTIHVDQEGIEDYSATSAKEGRRNYSRQHEFQVIGLVPGQTNEVTLTLTGSWGNVRQIVHFTVDMPDTQSGYATQLAVTDGTSAQLQADGLFTMMRVNGYLGYGFFYDNSGVLRYEMVLEGFGLDRLLFDGDELITCVSSTRLARVNGLGQVTQVYDLDGYELHHDIGFGREGEVLALAEHEGGETVEDVVLSIDLDSGAVTELLDFTQVMQSYFEMTRPVGPLDDFFWQAGEWDWIHLNSLQYLPEDDSLIVSSRETSAIIKIADIHGEPAVDWLAGDSRFWEDTPYAELCLTQEGDFVPQYGQHCVEYLKAGEDDGIYCIRRAETYEDYIRTQLSEPKLMR